MDILIYFDWPVKFWNMPDSHLQRLRERWPDETFTYVKNQEEAARRFGSAEIVIAARVSEAMANAASRLQWLQSSASSVSTLPLPVLSTRRVVVTNTRSLQGPTIAEHVMAGILVLSRQLNQTLAAQRDHRWIQDQLMSDTWPWTLKGKAMTVVGLGAIGQEVARRANAFDMRVTGVRRRPTEPAPPFVHRVVGAEEIDEAVRGCDVLVIAAPLLPSTDRLIGARQILLLNRGAVLVNVARSKVVDQNALMDALNAGHLGGAVLDVFDHEPLDQASPFWTLPNVVITPHTASLRPQHWDEVIELFGENLRRFKQGEPLLNVVDLAAGY
jgi:phosphoglycerate dehydrogenase-like enzyme